MGMRREARERAVQFLFQFELNPPEDLVGALNSFWTSQYEVQPDQSKPVYPQEETEVEAPAPSTKEVSVRLFADPLITGVIEHREELDQTIKKHVKNYALHRIAVVDRNILRLAIYEMLHRQDIPPIVSINEAVDIAKRFSTDDSGRFVNGILDKVKDDLMRPIRMVK